MALHLNLNHEIEKQRRVKSRDPLKFATYGLAAVAALMASYYALQLTAVASVNHELSRKTAEFKALEPKAEAAKKHEAELAATIKASGTMMRRIEERFYWAPLLDELTKLVPPEVQITRLNGEVEGDVIKKCVLKVDGMAAGADPRKVAEELRIAIEDHFSKEYKKVASNFRALEDGPDSAKLNGTDVPTATFAINVELATGIEAAATPPPVRRKK